MKAHARPAKPRALPRSHWRTAQRSAVIACLLAMIAGLPSALTAQGQACAPRETVVARLAETYGETRQSIGLGNNNAVMELFASDQTGSWTITVTSSSGVTCLIASGLAFERLQEALQPEESDA